MDNYIPNPFMTQPTHLPPLFAIIYILLKAKALRLILLLLHYAHQLPHHSLFL